MAKNARCRRLYGDDDAPLMIAYENYRHYCQLHKQMQQDQQGSEEVQSTSRNQLRDALAAANVGVYELLMRAWHEEPHEVCSSTPDLLSLSAPTKHSSDPRSVYSMQQCVIDSVLEHKAFTFDLVSTTVLL